ncbi:hypothetical protein D3C81_520870 [compost metagenome]
MKKPQKRNNLVGFMSYVSSYHSNAKTYAAIAILYMSNTNFDTFYAIFYICFVRVDTDAVTVGSSFFAASKVFLFFESRRPSDSILKLYNLIIVIIVIIVIAYFFYLINVFLSRDSFCFFVMLFDIYCF